MTNLLTQIQDAFAKADAESIAAVPAATIEARNQYMDLKERLYTAIDTYGRNSDEAGKLRFVLADRVVLDHRILDLVVAIDRRVGNPVHYGQGDGESVTTQPVQVVVAHGLAFVDHPDAAGVVDAVAEKHVVLDQVVVAVAQGQGAA